jgi:cell division protein FtsN
MEQRGLRDVERWRDKIEVRLDNRQVFFLFFGSALVACLLFVLGVIVGKRLESRGRAVAPEVEDPLALLDKIATTPRPTQAPAMTFPQALFGGKNAQNGAKKADLTLVEPTASSKNEPGKAGEGARIGEPKQPLTTPEKVASKPADGKLLAKLDNKPVGTGKSAEAKAPATVGKAAAATVSSTSTHTVPGVKTTPAPVASVSKTVAPPAASPAKTPVPVVGAAATDSVKGKVRFTLQLSSFQDRGEAEAFAAKLGAEKTYITISQIPDKGTWYRVRVGDFATFKDAITGKLAFEKKHGVVAYVAQR